MVIDHIALIVDARVFRDTERQFAAAGLTVSSRSEHVGQGTANLFYCFDNAFVEVLCVVDPADASALPVARLGVAPRADWRRNGATPVGIGLRAASNDALPFACWTYAPPGSTSLKPTGVAVASDDVRQPLIFRAQRLSPPRDWSDGRAGARQASGGFSELSRIRLELPHAVQPGEALRALARHGLVELARSPDHARVRLSLSRIDGGLAHDIIWPQA